jgi:mycofactocin precursor
MAEQAARAAVLTAARAAVLTAETDELTSDELLVEEVSIDGMCGVY